MQSSRILQCRAYREAILEGGRLGLRAVGNGGGQSSGQAGSGRLDSVDGGAGAHALLQAEGELPGSHGVSSRRRER